MRAMHRLLLAAALSSLAYNATYGGSIIHGVKAKKNTLQFMASVQLNRKHICGGFVIDSRHVLTAAHCNKSGNMSVVLGAKNIKALAENLQRYTVKKSYIYPSYDNPKTGGDIMLLKLSKTIARNKNVKIIQIPSKDKQVKANTKCLIAGWGKTETQNTVDDLRMTDVRTVDLKLCQKKWRDMNVELPAAALCAGGYKTKSGACQGDSGGPLVCNNVAVGIVSFNFKRNCDYPNLPNVYTEISKYRDWIKKIIGQRV
uniref:Peptidase S1 domain-containing protein n=2 Tax=Electrophorus electricus TaxID=8005 RepID=A0A4W4H8K7_ELEEL